jgi:hypothetical protein
LRGRATNIICSSGDLQPEAVDKTEIRLSDIFVFPRKTSRVDNFIDRATWLLLALEAPF